MVKERIPLIAGGAGILLLLIGIIGGAIEGRLGPLFLTLLLVGLAGVLFALYTSGTVVRTWMNRRSTRYGTNLAIMVVVAKSRWPPASYLEAFSRWLLIRTYPPTRSSLSMPCYDSSPLPSASALSAPSSGSTLERQP